jgi:hypothetical protein
MAKLIVNENFQFRGFVHRTDKELEVGDSILKAEVKKGTNKVTGKPVSGLVNHCSPADSHTAKIMGVSFGEEEEAPDALTKEEQIDKLRSEFDEIGKAYDPRWGLAKLTSELVKAKKETGN